MAKIDGEYRYDVTQGKCNHCRLAFNWKAGEKRRLKDTCCPSCGQPLKATVHYLKRYPWYSLDGYDITKPIWKGVKRATSKNNRANP